jgi:hypothetical protein
MSRIMPGIVPGIVYGMTALPNVIGTVELTLTSSFGLLGPACDAKDASGGFLSTPLPFCRAVLRFVRFGSGGGSMVVLRLTPSSG